MLKTASVLIKGAIGGGAVYVTVNQGIWSNSSNGSQAFRQVQTTVLPDATKYVNMAPSADDVSKTALDYWNCGVEKSFDVLSKSPDNLGTWSKDAGRMAIRYIRDDKS